MYTQKEQNWERIRYLTAMKKSRGGEAGGGRGVKRDRTKCRIEIQRTRKRDNTPDENTGNGGSNCTRSVDCSNVCEEFHFFDHTHVYYFISIEVFQENK